jgi:poly(3-hydroxybutyrate) depolymerase
VLDPERVYYFGASLGGIMGSVLMAYDPFIERGVLGVPGGAWSLLLECSYAWNALQAIATLAYEAPTSTSSWPRSWACASSPTTPSPPRPG